jgi:hypothetical protein
MFLRICYAVAYVPGTERPSRQHEHQQQIQHRSKRHERQHLATLLRSRQPAQTLAEASQFFRHVVVPHRCHAPPFL